MVVRRPRFPRDHESIAEISSIKRVFELKVLGVTFTDTLSMSAHVKHLGTKSAQTIYALRTLRAHGLCGEALWSVTRAHIISRLTYASSAWWGFCNAGERSQLEAVVTRLVKKSICPRISHPFRNCDHCRHPPLRPNCNESQPRLGSTNPTIEISSIQLAKPPPQYPNPTRTRQFRQKFHN